MKNACNVLSSTVHDKCVEFVDTYGNAFIALLAQDIDPSEICPRLSLCPSSEAAGNVEVFMHSAPNKKNCPLCLFAIMRLEEIVKGKRTRVCIFSMCLGLAKTNSIS